MTLEQLAGLGEIIAALGVVISLIYVARQIRQNTDAVQANTEQWWAQSGWSRLGLSVVATPTGLPRAAGCFTFGR